jgi:hypothetical protein
VPPVGESAGRGGAFLKWNGLILIMLYTILSEYIYETEYYSELSKQ